MGFINSFMYPIGIFLGGLIVAFIIEEDDIIWIAALISSILAPLLGSILLKRRIKKQVKSISCTLMQSQSSDRFLKKRKRLNKWNVN